MNSYLISFKDDDKIVTIIADGYNFDGAYFTFYTGELNRQDILSANAQSVRYVLKESIMLKSEDHSVEAQDALNLDKRDELKRQAEAAGWELKEQQERREDY